MKNCPQNQYQSIYDHGLSVKDHTFALISILESGVNSSVWKLPDWFLKYRKQLLSNLFDSNIIAEYTLYHDCGKAYCRVIDENGKQHFPNHAEISYLKWLEISGSPQAAELMRMDMLIHTMKSSDVDAFIKNAECCTLLIVGLAEIISNSTMFGGFESVSYKIKFKNLSKLGKNICCKLFGDSDVIE
jgi:hypothetical protein